MEVHHHGHHGSGKRSWKSYFWEFFMLFLAVFCGFLAELQLEHYVEHQREKKYVIHLHQDLSKDSVNLDTYLKGLVSRTERIDSMLEILVNDEMASRGNDLYYHARRIIRYPDYYPSEAAISQLKYSGNLRLIRDAELVRNLGNYENQTRQLLNQLDLVRTATQQYVEYVESIFDGKVFYRMLDSTGAIIMPTNNPQLLVNDRLEINRLIIKLQFIKGGNVRLVNLARPVFEGCRNLQQQLQEEYSL